MDLGTRTAELCGDSDDARDARFMVVARIEGRLGHILAVDEREPAEMIRIVKT